MTPEYQKYLSSPEWKEKRKARIAIDGKRCFRCKSPIDLQVHHLSYDDIWDAPMLDLVTLCSKCHERIETLKHLVKRNKGAYIPKEIQLEYLAKNLTKKIKNYKQWEQLIDRELTKPKALKPYIDNWKYKTRNYWLIKFIEDFKDFDYSARPSPLATLNLCNLKIVKSNWFSFIDEHLKEKAEHTGCQIIIEYFRNRRYEIIFDVINEEDDDIPLPTDFGKIELLTQYYGFSYAMVKKCIDYPDTAIKCYNDFEETWDKLKDKYY